MRKLILLGILLSTELQGKDIGPFAKLPISYSAECRLAKNAVGPNTNEESQCNDVTLAFPVVGNAEHYLKYSVSQSRTFVKYLTAIMQVESSMNPRAISDKGAYGLTQMTQPAVDEAAKYCGFPRLEASAMLVPRFAVQYGSCYLLKLIRETGDWDHAIISYNGGARQLDKHKNGDTMTAETVDYLAKVHSVLGRCSTDERK